MQASQFSVTIDEPLAKVWDTMLSPDTFVDWVSVSWPGLRFEGEWNDGTQVKFLTSKGGGWLVTVTSAELYGHVALEYVAIIGEDGNVDRASDAARSWIGATERFSINEKDGLTEVIVGVATSPELAFIFNEGFPLALQGLKRLCEQ